MHVINMFTAFKFIINYAEVTIFKQALFTDKLIPQLSMLLIHEVVYNSERSISQSLYYCPCIAHSD